MPPGSENGRSGFGRGDRWNNGWTSQRGGKRTFRIVRLLLLATNKPEFDETGIGVVGNPGGKAIEGPVGSAVCQKNRRGLTRSNDICARMAFRNC